MFPVTPYKATDVQLRSVLLATDFSAASDKALHHAVAIALNFGAKLYLMHVVSSLGLTLAGPEAIATAKTLALKDVSMLERRLVTNGFLRHLHHQVIVREGDVRAELERVVKEERIDLVVVGTHSRPGITKLVLGSIAEQIFRNSSCPVLTVGANSPAEAQLDPSRITRPILFPTDFGDKSLNALPYALSIAKLRETRLVLLHTLSPVPEVRGDRWYTADDVTKIRKGALASVIERLRALIPSSFLEVEPLCVADFGDPAEWILRTAEELQVEGIIMGLNHTSHIDTISHLPWTTTYKVVCEAVCPVLTVRS